MKLLGIIYWFYLFLLFSCINSKDTENTNKLAILNQNKNINSSICIIEDENYWKIVDPLSFLDTLEKYPNTFFCISTEPKPLWFRKDLISSIKSKLNNNDKAGIVYSRNENNIHNYKMNSTIAIQAKYILLGYKENKYPPTLCSYHFSKLSEE